MNHSSAEEHSLCSVIKNNSSQLVGSVCSSSERPVGGSVTRWLAVDSWSPDEPSQWSIDRSWGTKWFYDMTCCQWPLFDASFTVGHWQTRSRVGGDPSRLTLLRPDTDPHDLTDPCWQRLRCVLLQSSDPGSMWLILPVWLSTPPQGGVPLSFLSLLSCVPLFCFF